MAGNTRGLILSLVATAILSLLPLSSHATVDWNDGFEYTSTTTLKAVWSSSCTATQHTGIMEPSTARAYSGSRSLKLTYIGDNPVQTCFMDRFYPASTETMYTRIYMFLDNFRPSNINTKLYNHSNTENIGRYPVFWWSLVGTSNTHRMGVEGSAVTNLPAGTFPSGRWVCMETRVTLNTPGVANGIIQSWIDGVPRLNSTNLLLRNATEVVINGTPPNVNTNGPSNRMRYTRIYRQSGLGVIYFDDYAVSRNARIGCSGSTPAGDTTAPQPPVGVQ